MESGSKGYEERAFKVKVLTTIMNKLARADIERRLSGQNVNVSPLALAVLRYLKHSSVTNCELSRTMMIAPATLVPVIDSLDAAGLVRKGEDPKDRRRNPLTITAKGAELLSRVPAVSKEDILVKGLSGIGEKKATQLVKLLEELTTAMSGSDEICARISAVAEKEHGTATQKRKAR